MVEAQDGDATVLERMTQIHRAPVIREIKAERNGRITKIDAKRIGRASLLLGGGRQTANDAIDFAVGISDLKKVGEAVESGEILMQVHARAEKSCERALLILKEAVAIE
jgi:thymidine phosphorylase